MSDDSRPDPSPSLSIRALSLPQGRRRRAVCGELRPRASPEPAGPHTESDAKAPIKGAVPEGESAPDAGTKRSRPPVLRRTWPATRPRPTETTPGGRSGASRAQRRGDRDPAGHVRRARHRRHLRLRRPHPDDRVPVRLAATVRRVVGPGQRPDRPARAELLRRDHQGGRPPRRDHLPRRPASSWPSSGAAAARRRPPAVRVLQQRLRRALPGRQGCGAARGLPPAVDDPQPPDPARGQLPR